MESFVSPQDILNDETFRFSTPVEKPELLESIRTSGILTPLYVIQTDARYRPLSGFHRLEIARTLSLEQISVRIVDSAEISRTFYQILLEQSGHQPFNLMEKARVVSIIKNHLLFEESITRIGPLLELPREKDKLDRLAALADLPVSVQTYLETYPVPFKQLNLLFRFDAEDQARLTRLGLDLQIRSVELFEMARLCLDISKREKIAIPDVLERIDLPEILDNGERTRNQKIDLIKIRLRVLQSPQVVQWNEAIHKAVRSMQLESNIRFSWDHQLEAPGVQFSARLESEADFEAFKSRINSPETEKQLKKIFEII